MTLLSGPEIARQVACGRIVIDPFVPDHVGANSVDLRLGRTILVPATDRWVVPIIDMRNEPAMTQIEIPEEGLVLYPGTLYLGHTVEYTESPHHVPCIEGRSSVGRLGMTVHVTAGFGDVGFCGDWTLEITVVHPLRVYAGVRVCQISYATVLGAKKRYQGKYQGQRGPKPSGLWRDFLDGTMRVQRGI